MKKLISFLLLLSFASKGQNTSPITLSFKQSIKSNKSILLDSLYTISDGTSLKIETLKFYISKIQLLDKNRIVFTEENSFYLIDISDINSLKIAFNIPTNIKYTQLKFNLGIDSLTNVSGVYGGDLDPTKGMYWTWQSGYINFKLEGTCSVCPGAKKEFQFHVGGYQAPFNTLRELTLETNQKNNIEILLDLKQFLEKISLSKQNHIMSPNRQAVDLSIIIANAFRINKP
ncbi:MbnP family protein [Aurantibacillus circumpalustris]|uniref:MbnP family protein n=1 Tax=Aurantibacillus circumpalustris TaxID=3036359 RepID=UPI00295BD3B2|nr:MbnP family protein [Aurantibacillus circumpalustris]